jgi:S-adenosylmethionine:tRNA ribosyltransferase-isomerase
MRLKELNYDLPAERIAQRPLQRREDSRLLELDRATGVFRDRRFVEFPSRLRGDELLVLNNARVFPARLRGKRAGLAANPAARDEGRMGERGSVEAFLSRQVAPDTWEALVRPGKRIRNGERLVFGSGELQGEVIASGDAGLRTIRFRSNDARSVSEHLQKLGHVPLPPYIHRDDDEEDRERYQTVFAKDGAAVAAPTAGLHFTDEILEAIRQRGVEICELRLDVGLGTFQPVHTERLEDHPIHAESYEISSEAAQQINIAKSAGRRVVAIGTTVVRALEDSALRAERSGQTATVLAGPAEARVFITPGFQFRVVDALLTNFHLPRSTLLALVCAFAGREKILAAYNHAVAASYRFYSYGDCMWIR